MVPRCYPTVKGWTAELLKDRQRAEMENSTFGMGHMYDRYKKQPHEENDEDDEEEESQDVEVGTTNEWENFLHEWKEAAKNVKASMEKIVDVLEAAPEKLRNLNSFKIICDTTRNAVGLREEGVQHVIESQNTMTQAINNDETDDPEWIDIMIELTKAAERTYILKNRNEFPTFTLILNVTTVLMRIKNLIGTRIWRRKKMMRWKTSKRNRMKAKRKWQLEKKRKKFQRKKFRMKNMR